MMLPVLAGLFAGLQMADLTTALVMFDTIGIEAELNPIVVALYGMGGAPPVVALKLAAIALGVVCFSWLSTYRYRTACLLLTIGAVLGAIGAVSNIPWYA